MSMAEQTFENLAGKLDSLSPLAVLSRGYAVCQKLDHTLVTHVRQVASGEQVKVLLKSGCLLCRVEKGEANDSV